MSSTSSESEPMPEVLLMIPPFHYGDLSEAGPVYPSMGLVFVTAMLEKAGYCVKLIDMFALGYDKKELREYLKSNGDLKVAGVSSVSATFKTSLDILKLVKEVRPDVKTMIGGPHVTILPESTMQETYIDYGVLGEGDYTALELVDHIIKRKGLLEDIRGICFMKDGSMVKTEDRPFIENIDEIPFPAYHQLPMDKYRSYGVYDSGRKTTSMITSRGCPFKCIYCCSSKLFGGRWRPMSAKKTIEHIKKLYYDFGVRHIYFEDDEFTVSHERVIEICNWIIDSRMDLTWECLTRVSHVDEELLSRMAKAGCKSILYGVETGYEEGLVLIRKGITLEQVRNAIKLTQKHGMLAKASFIVGFPWESKKEIDKTIDFAIKLDADYAFFGILCPFPTTEVYEQISNEGLFVPDFSIDMYSAMPTVDSLIRTRHLTTEELVAMMGYAYKRLYFRPGYLLKRLKSIRHFSELKRNFRAGISVLRFSAKAIGRGKKGGAKKNRQAS
ncbi:MAG: radical SAM protein [Candidatus Altiarchaeota archaeon]|nr:radical SAM protein [Candidatus Altiarchaeota archaeon]